MLSPGRVCPDAPEGSIRIEAGETYVEGDMEIRGDFLHASEFPAEESKP
jgi:hypothetical protein